MNISFRLRKTGSKDPRINLFVFDNRFKGRKFIYSTSIDIKESEWDKRKNRPKIIPGSNNESQIIKLSKRLDHISDLVSSYLSDRYGETTLQKNELSSYLDLHLFNIPENKKPGISFFEIWKEIISTTTNPKTGLPIKKGTVRSKNQTLDLLIEYFKKVKENPNFESFCIKFYHSFDSYMIGKGLNGNTRGKHFKEIKAVLREAEDRDIEVNRSYQKKSFKVIRSNPDNIYLNDEEIKKIYNLKLTPSQEKLKDIFVMACYVGARHSDWNQITAQNIVIENGKELLKIKQAKTGEIVHIPLHDAVKSILIKYKESFPKVISNQKFNKLLKVICKKAELGNISIGEDLYPKADLVTTHTARRSFATNAYLSRSLDVYQIMRCTGHKSESSFLRYLKLDGRDYAIQAADSKFFKDQSWSMKIAS